MHSLKGKNALITGATSGIGLEVAKNFILSGANVTITGRIEAGEAIANEIGASFARCDIRDESQVKALFENQNKLDIVVANAGIAADEGSIEEFSGEQAKDVVDTNLLGTFYTLKYAPSSMLDGSTFIATGSVAGSGITHAGAAVYAASKAGVAYLVRAAAIENAPRAIRVNAVCPAMIADTGMMVAEDDPMADFLASLTAMGRMGKQSEVTGVYNFLASDSSSYISGQEIRVDGGASAGIGLPIFDALLK